MTRFPLHPIITLQLLYLKKKKNALNSPDPAAKLLSRHVMSNISVVSLHLDCVFLKYRLRTKLPSMLAVLMGVHKS